MRENLLDHHWVLDAGNDPGRSAAGLASLYVDVKYTLRALRLGHGYDVQISPSFGQKLQFNDQIMNVRSR